MSDMIVKSATDAISHRVADIIVKSDTNASFATFVLFYLILVFFGMVVAMLDVVKLLVQTSSGHL